MWQNSSELFDHALRELQLAVENNKTQVEIVLKESFTGDTFDMQSFCNYFRVKEITELLREKFEKFHIKSVVKKGGVLNAIITFESGPCKIFYPLVWELTLQEK